MKPYGLSYSVTRCTCALCRSRGYRKVMPTVVYDVPISIAHAGSET